MSDLNILQETFQASILRANDCTGDGIRGTERVSAATRLAIYSEAYRLRLIEALTDNYPTLCAVVGVETFDRLARAYLAKYPSQQPSIRWFGHRLTDFLAEAAPYCDRPELSELARFEWTLRDVFDAPDTDVLTLEDISGLSPEFWPHMQIRFHTSVRRIDLNWNVPAIWTAVDAGKPPLAAVKSEQPVAWVLWRKDLNQYFRSIDGIEAWALDSVRRGQPFAVMCEGMCDWLDPEQAPVHAASLLKSWVSDQMVSSVNA